MNLVAAALLALLAQDTPREHVETLDAPRTYKVAMGGVLDGTNTLSPSGYIPPVQGFEPMRSVRLENAGDADLVNPWLTVNGKRRWRSVREIVREALAAYGDPDTMNERDRARAIWEYQRRYRFHASTADNAENQDPVKMFNVYGYTLCGDDAPVLADLWRVAGLKTRAGCPAGHVLSEVWYEGAWHLLDGDEHIIYLLRDNATIASEEDLVRDHELAKRTHAYGVLQPDERWRDEFGASLFVHDGPRGDQHASHVGHTMDFTLRPGEALEWSSSHLGKHHYFGPSLKEGWGDTFLARLRNGLWTYAPPLRRASARKGVHASRNVRWSENASQRAIAPEAPGEPAWVVWQVRSPYAFVGGALSATTVVDAGDEVAVSISADGKAWTPVASLAAGETRTSLDPHFPAKGRALYGYFVKVEFKVAKAGSRSGLDAIKIQNDLQMSAFALPALEIGENAVAYSDESKDARSARITMRWIERGGAPLPAAPAAAVAPPDGGEVDGTRVRFQWSPVPDCDYHFQLSDQPDLKWVLSPNFDKLVSLSSGGNVPKATLDLPYAGLLNPGQRYYWRVRAKDGRSAWGPWSRVFSFTPQAPGVPLRLRWGERQGRDLTLLWDPAPIGRKPLRYAVYGSSEKGFTPSDAEYKVWAGNQKTGGLFPGREFVTFQSNRLKETSEPRLRFRPAEAYYRVVAIDDRGQVSGGSDVLAAPRPYIISDRPAQPRTEPGTEFRYDVKTISSIGDVRCHTVDGSLYGAAFWDADKPVFTLSGASWLKIHPITGVVTGTVPTVLPRDEIEITVTIPGVGTDRQTFTLSR